MASSERNEERQEICSSTLTEFHSLGTPAGTPASLGSLDSVAPYLSQQLSAIQGHNCKHKIYSTVNSHTTYPPLVGFTLIKAAKAGQDKSSSALSYPKQSEWPRDWAPEETSLVLGVSYLSSEPAAHCSAHNKEGGDSHQK